MLVDDATGEEKWSVQAHSAGDTSVAMSPDGRFVASVGIRDENWKLWYAASGTLHRKGAMRNGTGANIFQTRGLLSVAFSQCGEQVATRGNDGSVIVWDGQTGQAQQRMPGRVLDVPHCGGVSLTFSADGARLVRGEGINGICVWTKGVPRQTRRRGRRTELGGSQRPVRRPWAELGCMDEMDADLDTWISPRGCVTWVDFSPTDNGKLALAATTEGILVVNVDSGEMIGWMEGCCLIAEFSPDGLAIATVHDGRGDAMSRGRHDVFGVVKVVDVETEEVRCTMAGHTDDVSKISWSVSLTLNPEP